MSDFTHIASLTTSFSLPKEIVNEERVEFDGGIFLFRGRFFNLYFYRGPDNLKGDAELSCFEVQKKEIPPIVTRKLVSLIPLCFKKIVVQLVDKGRTKTETPVLVRTLLCNSVYLISDGRTIPQRETWLGHTDNTGYRANLKAQSLNAGLKISDALLAKVFVPLDQQLREISIDAQSAF